MAQRFINGGLIVVATLAILDAHKRVRMEEICKTYKKSTKEADAEKERGKNVVAALAPSMAMECEVSWKVEPKNKEEEKQLLGQFKQFYEKLFEIPAAKNYSPEGGNGSSTSLSPHDADTYVILSNVSLFYT